MEKCRIPAGLPFSIAIRETGIQERLQRKAHIPKIQKPKYFLRKRIRGIVMRLKAKGPRRKAKEIKRQTLCVSLTRPYAFRPSTVLLPTAARARSKPCRIHPSAPPWLCRDGLPCFFLPATSVQRFFSKGDSRKQDHIQSRSNL
jgi:hypothetical protein